MTLSEEAWDAVVPVVRAIKNHPFNLELAQGTLAQDVFGYYVEQDTLYLQDFARCHALLAARAPLEHMEAFLRYANATLVAEQEVVHVFFKARFELQETGRLAPATLSYTSALLRWCALEPVEVGLAALLPCFWVYREVGLSIAAQTIPENPYQRWIDTYTGEEFAHTVHGCIALFDMLAARTHAPMRQMMLDVFYKSTCLEWHFWNDAYHQRALDAMA